MFRDIYPKYGGEYETLHYTEYLAELLDAGKLSIYALLEARTTYHDPCYLGRHAKIFGNYMFSMVGLSNPITISLPLESRKLNRSAP